MSNKLQRVWSLTGAFRRSVGSSPALSPDICTEGDLVAMARKGGFGYFTNYIDQREVKRRSFAAAIAHLKVELSGATVLDVGPGTGDSLDVARELGARSTQAIDSEPYFVRLALLRGHCAWLRDCTLIEDGRYFPPEVTGATLVWCKGALNCSEVNRARSWGSRAMLTRIRKGFCFQRWIRELQSLVAPSGTLVFVPAVDRRPTKICDPSYPIETYHYIDDPDAWDASFYASVLRAAEFESVKNIPYVNHPLAFPTAWVWRRRA